MFYCFLWKVGLLQNSFSWLLILILVSKIKSWRFICIPNLCKKLFTKRVYPLLFSCFCAIIFSINIFFIYLFKTNQIWPLGLWENVNWGLRDKDQVDTLLAMIDKLAVQTSARTLFTVLFYSWTPQPCLAQQCSFANWESIFGNNC